MTEATKMQAKLVAFDDVLASDPLFPFKGSLGATGSRVQEPIRVANYFWVVAAAGNFHFDFPRPPQAAPDAGNFKYFVVYMPADRCHMSGGYSTEGLGLWPAWFDRMTALSEVNIK